MGSPVVIVPYDAVWVERFERLKSRLAIALGDLAIAIEHVGSTAVPGLAAKPIIDIDVVIESEDQLNSTIERLSSMGYAFEGDLGIPGRYAFSSPPKTAEHHLYVCAKGNRELERHLTFRDYLTRNPKEAAAYAALKYAAAHRFGQDRVAYSDAKHDWVEKALQSARLEQDGAER